MGGEQEHPCRELVTNGGPHDGQAVEVGHLVVDQRDVGSLTTDRLEGVPPVPGFGDDHDTAVLRQPPADAVTEEGVVIGDHDPHPGIRG